MLKKVSKSLDRPKSTVLACIGIGHHHDPIYEEQTSKMDHIQAYQNLNTKTWSIRHKGKVISHPTIAIISDATFHVQQGGHARVISSGQRSVHAYIKGTLVTSDSIPSNLKRVYYNPFRSDKFELADGTQVTQATTVYLMDDKKAYISA